MTDRIARTFQRLRAANSKAFVAYITAGDPSLARTAEISVALERAGTDILELGVPFSDPLADGAVNQMAAMRALESGTTIRGIFDLVVGLRTSGSEMPVVLFTYLNPVFAYGYETFHRDAAAAGVDGVLILDLPPDEAELNEDLRASGLAHIQLVAPTTPPDRIARIAAAGSGFLYCVSREGVTGVQSELSDGIAGRVAQIRAVTDLPVVVGFGISTAAQTASVAESADGVVVGSAIVSRIAELGDTPDLAARIADFVRPLATATRGTASVA